LGSRRPKKRLITAPRRGSAGTSQSISRMAVSPLASLTVLPGPPV
jgi:hypothetical protein